MGPLLRGAQRWWLDRPLRVKGLVVVAIPVVPLVLLSLIYFPAEWRDRALEEELHYALDLGQKSQELIISIQEVRGELRSYLFTGNPQWRDAYARAREQVPPAMDQLEGVLEDRAGGPERARALRALTDRKLDNLQRTLELGEVSILQGELRGPEADDLDQEGHRIMDSLRVVMDPLRTRADSVLAEIGDQGPLAGLLPPLLVGTASLLGILGGVAAGLLFSSAVAGRIRTLERNTRHLARGEEPLLPVKRSQDEIGRLGRGLERADRILRGRQSELRQARHRAEAATRAKSAFLAAMSHELRTPLNAIIGFAELLEDGTAGDLNQKQARYVRNVHSSGRHLLELINDILDLSKVEAGRMDLLLQETDAVQLLRSSAEIIRATAGRKEIQVELDLPEALPPLTADPGRLKQVLYNLLSNAVKFTEEGGRVVLGARAETSPEADAPSQLLIWVQDSGIGIPEEAQARIFQEFEQVDSSMAREVQGTGLGLTLVRKLVELHGGEVSVESRVDEGSTFSVLLPLDGPPERSIPGAPPEETGETTPDPPAILPGDGPLILVVEDDAWARQLLAEYLHEAGYRTLLADTEEKAIRLAREEAPDAITLDIALPEGNGWDLLRSFRSDPATRDTPVFIITISEGEEMGFALGATAFFQKPVNRERLLSALQAAVPAPPGKQLQILVVDDDPEQVRLVRDILEDQGHLALEARGGGEGIEMARRELPDLVILDLLMPDVSGFDVAAALRESPETEGIPILVWTAKDLTRADRERLHGRVQAVSSKAGPKEFLAALNRVLAGRMGAVGP